MDEQTGAKKVKKEKKPGAKKKLLLIIIAVVAVGGAAAAYFLLPKSEKPIVYSYYSPGEYFVTNVKDSSRLLKASIVLVLNTDDSKLQEDLTLRNSIIRDSIIFLLRDLNEDAIKSTGTQDNLRQSIVKQLNNTLDIDNIVTVMFNDFVMQ